MLRPDWIEPTNWILTSSETGDEVLEYSDDHCDCVIYLNGLLTTLGLPKAEWGLLDFVVIDGVTYTIKKLTAEA